jgi:uncharacterized membrane protein YeaQ/YmgE (transglycosylase-associated protein family)
VTLGFILLLLVWGFIVGGLARFAVPGPDPMPVWMTIALGLAGSILGGIIGRLLFGASGGFFLAFLCAVLLVIAYRRYVQHRPIWGPGAHRPPGL